MSDTLAVDPPAVLAYTPAEAAQALRVSERTIDDLVRSGKLNASRVGRHRRITPAAITDYLNANPWRVAA